MSQIFSVPRQPAGSVLSEELPMPCDWVPTELEPEASVKNPALTIPQVIELKPFEAPMQEVLVKPEETSSPETVLKVEETVKNEGVANPKEVPKTEDTTTSKGESESEKPSEIEDIPKLEEVSKVEDVLKPQELPNLKPAKPELDRPLPPIPNSPGPVIKMTHDAFFDDSFKGDLFTTKASNLQYVIRVSVANAVCSRVPTTPRNEPAIFRIRKEKAKDKDGDPDIVQFTLDTTKYTNLPPFREIDGDVTIFTWTKRREYWY